jgi:CBS-domain-containing membrane protein
MKGGAGSPPGVNFTEVLWSWVGAFTGISLCGYLSSLYFEQRDLTLLIGSFGASAVLLYGAIKSPLAQPRNLIGGHVISALIGVACFKILGETQWMASAFAVSLSISAMLMTKTLHPPGGATALIAVIGGRKIQDLGFLYAFIPAGAGALILLIVALLVNNLAKNRRYPEFWI